MKNNKPDIMIAFLISLAFFIELLDTTIINTSIPQMAISFNVPETAIKLAITSYLIALAIFIPISGWFADKFGSRTIFCFAIFYFYNKFFILWSFEFYLRTRFLSNSSRYRRGSDDHSW